MDTIKIGGKEYEVRFKYVTCLEIMKRFNRVFTENKYDSKRNKQIDNIKNLFATQQEELKKYHADAVITDDEYREKYKELTAKELEMIAATKATIPDTYFFDATWKVLKKRGIWPLRKPFRSYKHMMQEIEKDEAVDAVHLIGAKILGYDMKKEDDKKKVN